MTLVSWQGNTPRVPESAFVAEGAVLIGRVTLGEHASVWPNTVARGDVNAISIGDYSNVQDLCVLHVADDHPCVVERHVTVGHHVTLHGCTVRDHALVGIGAIVLNGAVVEKDCLVGAGALIPEGMRLEAGHLYLGVPAKKIRRLTEEEIRTNRGWAEKYYRLARSYREPIPWETLRFGL